MTATGTAPRDEKNGVVRPSAGTTGARVWAVADAISQQKSAGSAESIPATKEEVAAQLPDVKAATVSVEYSKWRKYYGLAPKRASKPRSVAAGSPRINPQPPYQEGDVVGNPGQQQQLGKDASGGWAWKPYTPPAPVAPPPPPAQVTAPPPPAPVQQPVRRLNPTPPYQIGDEVNGHRFDGKAWNPIPVSQPPAPLPAPAPMIQPAPPAPAPVQAMQSQPMSMPPAPPAMPQQQPMPPAMPPVPPAPPALAPQVPPAPPLVPPAQQPTTQAVTPQPPQQQPRLYKAGDVVNGHMFDGAKWVPCPQTPPPPPYPPAPTTFTPQIEVVGEDPQS